MNDESPRLANSVLDLSANVSKLVVQLERLLREIRDAEVAAEVRERGHTDALLKIYEKFGGVSEGIRDVKAHTGSTGTFPKVDDKVPAVSFNGWRLPIAGLWRIAQVAIPLLTAGVGYLVRHLMGH